MVISGVIDCNIIKLIKEIQSKGCGIESSSLRKANAKNNNKHCCGTTTDSPD